MSQLLHQLTSVGSRSNSSGRVFNLSTRTASKNIAVLLQMRKRQASELLLLLNTHRRRVAVAVADAIGDDNCWLLATRCTMLLRCRYSEVEEAPGSAGYTMKGLP